MTGDILNLVEVILLGAVVRLLFCILGEVRKFNRDTILNSVRMEVGKPLIKNTEIKNIEVIEKRVEEEEEQEIVKPEKVWDNW